MLIVRCVADRVNGEPENSWYCYEGLLLLKEIWFYDSGVIAFNLRIAKLKMNDVR